MKKLDQPPEVALEERVRQLELKLATLTGAFGVGVAAIVAFMGITSWVTMPSKVEDNMDEMIPTEIREQFNKIAEVANEAIESSNQIVGAKPFRHVNVKNDEWRFPNSSDDWVTVGNLSTKVTLTSDSILILVANGQSKITKPDWIYLSFFVDGELVSTAPVHDGEPKEVGPYVNNGIGNWMSVNFTQIHMVTGIQQETEIEVELKVMSSRNTPRTKYHLNGMSIDVLTLPIESNQELKVDLIETE